MRAHGVARPLVRALAGWGGLRRRFLSWALGALGRRERTIMLLCPTFADKAYCLDDWIAAVKALRVPPGYGLHVWVIENNRGRAEDVSFYKEVCEKTRGTGWFICHYTGAIDTPSREHLANVLNHGLAVFLQYDYDYLWVLEADVIPTPWDLWSLLAARKSATTGLVCYGEWEGDIGQYRPADPAAGRGLVVPLGDRARRLRAYVDGLKARGVAVPPHLEAALSFSDEIAGKAVQPDGDDPIPMAFKSLSRSGEEAGHTWTLLATSCDDKAGAIPVAVALSHHGFSIQARGFTWREIRAWPHHLMRVAASGLGCILLRRDVFQPPWWRLRARRHPPLVFRWLPGTESYNDIVFCQDLQSRGWSLWCNRAVRPEHRHRQWVTVEDA